ncbi:hypothetical protein WN55_09120, partial [Dufourea novaeangliae]
PTSVVSRDDSHLLLSDVYRFVQDDPRGGLVAGRHRGGAVVRHVIFRVRQEFPHHETLNLHRLTCVHNRYRSINAASDKAPKVLIIFRCTYLRRKRMSIDSVLAPGSIVQAEVQMDLVELITVAQRTVRYVHGMTRVVVHREDNAVPGVRQYTGDFVLVQMQRLEIRVEKKSGRLEVHRRLSSALVAEPPVRIDQTPEAGTFVIVAPN